MPGSVGRVSGISQTTQWGWAHLLISEGLLADPIAAMTWDMEENAPVGDGETERPFGPVAGSSHAGVATGPYREPAPFRIEAQGHGLHFYPAGDERFAALLALIEGAQHSLKLCFYIFAEDYCGQRVRDALADAAGRGVSVVLMVDSFGTSISDSFFARLLAAGGRLLRFSPRLTRHYLIRNHQKIVIADNARAMIGGFNIENSYFDPPQRNGWNDLGVTVSGPVVARLADWFVALEDWSVLEKGRFREIRRLVREWDGGTGSVRLLMGGPTKGLSSWARCVTDDLEKADRLDMIMAYFSPATILLRRIGRIARKGRVRLLFPAKSDNGATLGASRLLYRGLLKRDARIWEFSPSKLHTKLIVLDDVVYIGSANFDMRSLYLNLELMLRIEDKALADRLRAYMGEQLAYSQSITPQLDRSRRTMLNRLRWTVSWFLVSVVDYTVTRRLNLGL